MSEPLTAAQRVAIARHPQRPNITDYIQALFTDFFEQKGDRLCGEDAAILGGVALYHGRPVTVIGTRKGKTLEENLKCNFGMPNPEGYRKALRLMRQAEKFRRPILTFIDTSGAYPGLEAEAHGQGEAIARNLYEMSRLTVPVIALITGEGNSGGALALGVANRVLMLENSVYAILSPEGFASILWKDSARHEEACELMKLTAPDLLELGVIDGIIPEPEGGAHLAPAAHMRQLLGQQFRHLCGRGDRIPREKTQPRIECPTHAGFVALSKQNALFAVHAPSPDSPGPSSPRHSTARSGQYNSHRPQPTHSAGAYSGFPSPSSESAPERQNATHTPQPLHHCRLMRTFIRLPLGTPSGIPPLHIPYPLTAIPPEPPPH